MGRCTVTGPTSFALPTLQQANCYNPGDPEHPAAIGIKTFMLLGLAQAAGKHHRSTAAAFAHFGALGLLLFAILDSSPIPTFGGADILLVILVAARPNPWYEFAGAAVLGSAIGAYLTFRLARRAGRSFFDSKWAGRRAQRSLEFFESWGTGALVASTAIPLPLPTGLFFAAAGVSGQYSSRKFLTIVTASRAVRYSAVALIAHLYGRHVIRILRHPTQNLHWLVVLAVVFAVVIAAGIIMQRQLTNKPVPHSSTAKDRGISLSFHKRESAARRPPVN